MDRFEVSARLCEELKLDNIHLNTGGKDVVYSEEEYQKLKKFLMDMAEKHAKKGEQ